MTTRATTDIEVLVIGEALVDITATGSEVVEMPGGGPANVALGLGRQGIAVALLTRLGSDARGSAVTRHLERSGVWVLAESFGQGPTSTAHAHILDDGSARYEFSIHWTVSRESLPVRPRTIHAGSVAAFLPPGDEVVLEQIDRLAPEIVTFDPNIRPALVGEPRRARARFEEFARRSTVVKLSDEDAEYLYPGLDEAGLLALVGGLGPRLVALTRGARGAVLAAEGMVVEVTGRRVAVADTIGAGDTFMASLVVDYPALHDTAFTEQKLQDLAIRAVDAAAITVGRPGADLPWSVELHPAS
ncbi:PfkB family carbohydrate kinase [Microbacterium ureisolvens]|uniref:Carbohydrate kinase n=1 Tax=Microbacterium ureisolvens TaxID=2781186 RepID=A0ABS7I1B8_9MICO|nr:PfkB family carbohydrate kinase [Microbacterium ureisolvens]MBW9111447.1 carbohydrate kinase [Microbacterium ureisolvens]